MMQNDKLKKPAFFSKIRQTENDIFSEVVSYDKQLLNNKQFKNFKTEMF